MLQPIQPSSAPQATDDSNFGGPNTAQMAAAAAATKQQPVSQLPNYINAPLDKTGMAVTNPVNTPVAAPKQPASEPTVLSSGNINDTVIPNNNSALTQLSNKGQYSQDGVVYNSDGTLAPASTADHTAPQQGQIPQGGTDNGNGTYSLNGLTYSNAPDPQTETINANIQHLQSTLDASTKASIDAISKQYAQLIDAQKTINAGASAARNNALLTGGTSRYSPDTASGIMQTQLSFGLQQIAKLDSDENTAIAQAQAAQQNGEAQLADKLITDATALRTQKQTIANQLNDALSKANAAILQSKQEGAIDDAVAAQMGKGITDPAAIYATLSTNGMTVTAAQVAASLKALTPTTPTGSTALKMTSSQLGKMYSAGLTPTQVQALSDYYNGIGNSSALSSLTPQQQTIVHDALNGLSTKVPAAASTKAYKSGTLNYTASDLSDGNAKLESSKGDDGYVNPDLYMNMANAWTANGGSIKDFLKNFPVSSWVNPENTYVTPQINALIKQDAAVIKKTNSSSSSTGRTI